MRGFASVAILLTACPDWQDAPKPAPDESSAIAAKTKLQPQAALSRFNTLVGEWRGVGQPKRGSNRGAWSEKTSWRWDFSKKNSPALCMIASKGKLIDKAWLRFHEPTQRYGLEVLFANNKNPKIFLEQPVTAPVTTGKDKSQRKQESATSLPAKIVFKQPQDKDAHRVTLHVLSSKRMTLLVERGGSSFRRVGGIGYTRKGQSIAARGDGNPVCIVTGGTGTIKVTNKGKTYYVCCSGCQQAFEDDPDGVIADYLARLKQQKAAKSAAEKATEGR
jgi:YHS domain-containing protein